MKRFRAVLLVMPLLLAGCGGGGGSSPTSGSVATEYSVTPDKATVMPGGAVLLQAHASEGGAFGGLDLSVREGDAGGAVVGTSTGTVTVGGASLVDGATYTAPTKTGTYHVDVRFLGVNPDGSGPTRTATITVKAADGGAALAR